MVISNCKKVNNPVSWPHIRELKPVSQWATKQKYTSIAFPLNSECLQQRSSAAAVCVAIKKKSWPILACTAWKPIFYTHLILCCIQLSSCPTFTIWSTGEHFRNEDRQTATQTRKVRPHRRFETFWKLSHRCHPQLEVSSSVRSWFTSAKCHHQRGVKDGASLAGKPWSAVFFQIQLYSLFIYLFFNEDTIL